MNHPINDSKESDAANHDRGRTGVVAVIIENQKLLVIRRSSTVRAPNLICLPGGGVEPGESFEQSMVRELMEELQLSATVESHLWSSVTKWGTTLHWMVCLREPTSTPVPNPEEVAEVMWMSPAELRHRTDLLGSLPDFFDAIDRGELKLDL